MSRRLRNRTILIAGAGLAVGAVVLSGCSGSPSSTPSSSASTSESSSPIGGNVLPPIMVDGQQSVSVKVGDTIVVTTDGVTKVTTNHPEMLEVSQPHSDGSATFNGGAKVVKAGEGDLSVYGANDKFLYLVTVTATVQ